MTDARVRVLIYESYAFNKISGELRTVLYLLKYLDRSRFEPIVVVPEMVDALETERDAGTDVTVVEPPDRLQRYGRAIEREYVAERIRTIFDVVRYGRTLRRAIRAKRADVVYCCSLRALLLVGPAARLSGTPILFFVNGELQNPLLDAFAYTIAGKVVFQCGANRDDKYPRLQRFFRKKLAVVPSGVDLMAIIGAQQSLSDTGVGLEILSTDVNVIALGLLNREKGLNELVEALAMLGDRLTGVRVFIVGDQVTDDISNYRDELKALVRTRGLESVIRFTGWRSDALQILARMDVLVHASLTEGMPRVVLEAMAMGKAVVATRVGCSREVIRHGETGLLVPPGDVAALASALAKVVAERPLRESLGRAAACSIQRDFRIEDKVRQFEALFENLVGRRAVDSTSAAG